MKPGSSQNDIVSGEAKLSWILSSGQIGVDVHRDRMAQRLARLPFGAVMHLPDAVLQQRLLRVDAAHQFRVAGEEQDHHIVEGAAIDAKPFAWTIEWLPASSLCRSQKPARDRLS